MSAAGARTLIARAFHACALGAALAFAGAAQAQTTKLEVGYVPVIGASPLFVLDGEGWAKSAGLALNSVKFDSGPNAIQGAASGRMDALVIGVAPLAVARARGIDLVIVATMSRGGSGLVATGKLQQAFDAAGGDPAKAFAQFRATNGRPAKIGTLPAGAGPTVALTYWLKNIVKAPASDVDLAFMGIEAVQQAVMVDGIDGGTVLEPSLSAVLTRNPNLKVIASEAGMFPDAQGVGVAVSGKLARENPQAVEKLVALIVRATQAVQTNPEGAADQVQKVLGGGLLPKPVVLRALTSPTVTWINDPRAAIEPTRRMLAFQVESGDIQQAPAIDGLFDVRYYERAIASSAK
ncbi:MAG: ABC transporter substrate-binding protein [Beijerinckiaceae bacterium]|nr:ABC transporter substrate-binding protein [Beijerinckiaceae bacterium]